MMKTLTLTLTTTRFMSKNTLPARNIRLCLPLNGSSLKASLALPSSQQCCQAFSSNAAAASATKSLDSEKATKDKSRTLGILFLGSIVAGTAGLGVWQTQRYFWKVDKIEERKRRLKQTPRPLPVGATVDSLAELSDSPEYTPCTVSGFFLHDQEILVGPRSAPKSVYGAATGLGTNPTGCLVLTPLQRPDGTIVIVNRGWVPKAEIGSLSQPSGTVQLSGIVMKGEMKARFTPDNDEASNLFFWIDHEYLRHRVSHLWKSESLPILLEQFSPENASKGPWPYSKPLNEFEEFHVMPETHAVYALTWYSLACFGTVATWIRFKGRKRLPFKK